MAASKLATVVTQGLDEPKTVKTLGRDTRHSRSHFFRLFRALNTGPPAAMRRRLLLERAAWSLTNTHQRGFKLSPSLYRRVREDGRRSGQRGPYWCFLSWLRSECRWGR